MTTWKEALREGAVSGSLASVLSASYLAWRGARHGEIAAPQLIGLSDHVFRQPASRDTGLALYVAIAMIKRWTPNAIITITPIRKAHASPACHA